MPSLRRYRANIEMKHYIKQNGAPAEAWIGDCSFSKNAIPDYK
jgi:hypothetical protein